MGCDKNISLDLRHNPLISPSDNCTFLPGLAPRTVENNTLENQSTWSHARRCADCCDSTRQTQSRMGFLSGPVAYLPTVSIWCCRCLTCHCRSLFRRYGVSVCVSQNCIRYVVVRCFRHPNGPTMIYNDYNWPVYVKRV